MAELPGERERPLNHAPERRPEMKAGGRNRPAGRLEGEEIKRELACADPHIARILII